MLASCSSPLDVDAKRGPKVVIGTKPYDIYTNVDTLDFEYVHPYISKQLTFTVFNNTSKDYKLNDIAVENSTQIMSISDFTATTLKPKNQDYDNVEITVTINADYEYGYYSDELVFNGLENPRVYVKAIIPAVYGEDIDFGETQIGEDFIGSEFLTLRNISDKDVTISNLSVNDDTFEIKSSDNTFQLKAGSTKEIIITFEPKENIIYETELIFDVDDNSIISDKSVKLSGIGTN